MWSQVKNSHPTHTHNMQNEVHKEKSVETRVVTLDFSREDDVYNESRRWAEVVPKALVVDELLVVAEYFLFFIF